jgi:hypothetical protein
VLLELIVSEYIIFYHSSSDPVILYSEPINSDSIKLYFIGAHHIRIYIYIIYIYIYIYIYYTIWSQSSSNRILIKYYNVKISEHDRLVLSEHDKVTIPDQYSIALFGYYNFLISEHYSFVIFEYARPLPHTLKPFRLVTTKQ